MLTLLTASLPERRGLLAEGLESVSAQTVKPAAHMIGIDHHREGAAVIYNRLAQAVDTEWMAFLDDDDLIDPNHIEMLVDHLSKERDVVYTGCRSEGYHFESYNVPFDAELLQRNSIVPITAAIRTSVFRQIGGFPDNRIYDWDLWRRAGTAGARFHQIQKITWTYRLHHGGNQSLVGKAACH